jgi:hypothetical protein
VNKYEQLSIQKIKKQHLKPCFDMCSALGLSSNIPRDLRLAINNHVSWCNFLMDVVDFETVWPSSVDL